METPLWADMFRLGLPIAEKILRPALVYVFLVAGLRLAGKRELAQLNPFDLVVLLTLSNTVQNAIIGDDNSLTGGVIGAGTLLLINYVVVRFVHEHERLGRLIEGQPTILVDHGRIQADHLRKELITPSELEAAAHKQGIASLDEVDRAVLEPGGTIAFVVRKPSPEESRHREVLAQIGVLAQELDALRAAIERRGPAHA